MHPRAQTLLVNGAPLSGAGNLLGQSPLAAVLSHPALLAGGGGGAAAEAAAAVALRGLALAMLSYGAPASEPDGEGLTPAHRVALLRDAGALVKALAKRGGALGAAALAGGGAGGADEEALAPLHLACGASWGGEDDPRGDEGAVLLLPPPGDYGAGEAAVAEGPPGAAAGEGAADGRGAIGSVRLARPPCVATLSALLSWGAPPNALTGATGEAPLHIVLRQLLALRRAAPPAPAPEGEGGGGGSGSGGAGAAETAFSQAALLLAAHGARCEVTDGRGVSAEALAAAAGLKRQLEHAFAGWAAKPGPGSLAAAAALGGGGGGGGSAAPSPAAEGAEPGAARGKQRSGRGFAAFGDRLLGTLKELGKDLGGEKAAAAAAAAAAPCRFCGLPCGAAPRRCALCGAGGCAGCVARTVAAPDSDDEGSGGASPATAPASAGGAALRSVKGLFSAASAALKSGDIGGGGGGGGGSAPPSPAAAAPPSLCAGCFNRAVAAEMAAAADAAAWAAEKAAAISAARNFEDGGGGAGAVRGGRLSALAERTSKLPGASAAPAPSAEAARAALFSGAPARAAAAAAAAPPATAAGKLGGMMGGLTSLLASNKEALVARGEKLSRAEERSADLADSAAEFGSLAAQLKKKAQGGWGW